MSYLSRLSLANRSIVALVTIAVLLLGGFIIPSLKQELFPSISFPTISVVATYAGASPDIVERDVSEPLEQNIEGIKGLQTVTSYSNQGVAILTVSFDYGTDIDQATQTITQRINKAQSSLPSGVTPQVQSFSISDLPVIQMAVSADEDQQVLADALKHDVVPALEKIDGVGSVNVTGVRTQIVTITVDPKKLKDHGITFSQLQGVLQANNIKIPAGSTTNDGKTLPINTGNTFDSLDDLRNLIIGVQTSQTSQIPTGTNVPGMTGGNTTGQTGLQQTTPPIPVKLKDVATVKEDLSPSTSLTRTNGQPSLGISIVKTSNGNTVAISQEVNKQLSDLEKKLGHNAKISVISDQAPTISQSVSDLVREGVIGAVFAIIVILIFLFSIRSTLVTAVSIPLSIVIALIGLYVGNYTLNILTLGGLTIAVGRVVDDSIVVLENIYRHLQNGEEKKSAILSAVREVAGAVTASTLTTVSVFLPIAFTSGMVGELFRSFSVAVTVALLASLFVSLTIIPVLAYWFLKAPKSKPQTQKQTRSHSGGWLERGYVAIVGWVTGHWWQRTILIIAAIALLVGSFSLAGRLQTNLFGSSNQGSYSVSLKLAPATSLDEANKDAQEIEQAIADLGGMKTYQVTVGSGGGLSAFTGGGGSNSVSFTITTKDGIDQTAFEKALRDRLDAKKDLGTITVSAGGGGGVSSSNLEVDIQSSDDQTLRDTTKMVQDEISSISGLNDITSSLTDAAPQIEIDVDPTKALLYGMTPAQVAQNVRLVYSGSTVSHITLNGTQQDVDLFIGNPASNLDDIKNLTIPTTSGNVKIKDLATVKQVNGPTQITHIDGNRTATVTATVTDSNVGAISNTVQQHLDKLDIPSGATVSLGGVSSDLNSTFRDLGLAVLIAIILVYCIMVATFRSLLQPVILLISIPFAATGSLVLLLATNTPLGAAAIIGFLMLVGIVVTNAIVLLDLVRQYREQGLSARDAVIEGGRHRLRPILMTAIATILALMPMVLGIGGEGSGGFISKPLAIVVIGGLTTSTILTLIVVPTLYVIVESMLGHSGPTKTEPPAAIDEKPTAPEVAVVH